MQRSFLHAVLLPDRQKHNGSIEIESAQLSEGAVLRNCHVFTFGGRNYLKVFCIMETISATPATAMMAQKYSMLATRVDC